MAIRKIPIQTRSFAGKFFSIKNNSLINYESQLEYACMLMLEFNDDVIKYEVQPLKVSNYIPDVLAQRKNNFPLLIEVKYSNEAYNPNEKLKKKFATLEKYAKDNNLEFKIFTEQEITEPYFTNIKHIYNFANQKVNPQIESLLIKNIPSKGISIKALFHKLNLSSYEILIYKGYIMNLLYKKLATTDLNKKITDNSIIYKG